MKLLVFTLSVLMSTQVFSQGNWEILSPSTGLANLNDVEFVSPSKGYVVGYSGTIVCTEDGGQTWTFQNQNDTMNIEDVFFIDEQEGWATGWHDVLHTVDGGEHWELQELPLPNGMELGTNSVFFLNQDEGWIAGDYSTLYHTSDGGENWDLKEFLASYHYDKILFSDELNGIIIGSVFGLNEKSYVRTTKDGGITWNVDTLDYDPIMEIQYISKDTVFACGYSPYVLRSLDGGKNWEEMDSLYYPKEDMHFFDSKHGVLLGSTRTWHTYDGGYNWEVINAFWGIDSFYPKAFDFIDSLGYTVGSGGKVLKSTDWGKTWVDLSSPSFPAFSELFFFDEINGIAISDNTVQNDFYTTTDGGYTWMQKDIGYVGSLKDLCFPSQDVGYLNPGNGNILKSMDGGENWNMLETDLTFNIKTMAFFDDEKGFVGGIDGELYKTVDGGVNWEQISLFSGLYVNKIRWIDESVLWLNAMSSSSVTTNRLYYSLDGGDTWEISTNSTSRILDFYFISSQIGYFVNKYGVVNMTVDGGTNWEEMDGLQSFSSNSPAKIVFLSEKIGWIINNVRLYYTLDGGASWESKFYSSQMKGIYFLDDHNGWISGTDSFILKYYDSDVYTQGNDFEKKIVFAFPNPARDLIHIHNLEKQYHNIKVYDLYGRLRKNISTFGQMNQRIEVSDLEAGVYLLCFEGKKGSNVLKVVIE